LNKSIKGYNTLTKYQNKKCFYGIGIYKRRKVFYKEFESLSFLDKELNGYNIVKDFYNVPKLVGSYDNTILYEYKKDLVSNTLYEYLYFNKKNIKTNLILNQYKNSLLNIKKYNETKLCNYTFFAKRKDMIEDYLLNINDIKFKNILKDMLDNICKNKSLYSFISQGDPTDTNISTKGCFTDFENGGYNSIVGEISIFLVSLLTHGAYFYPKYNSKVYKIRDEYQVNRKISDKNIKFILSYLNMIKNTVDKKVINELDKYLKYYICFRLLTPINIINMEEIDKKIIINLVKDFYQVNSLDELIELINNWNISYIEDFINNKTC
jgi:hypothetical protein